MGMEKEVLASAVSEKGAELAASAAAAALFA